MFCQSHQKLSFLFGPFPFDLKGVYAFMFAVMLGGFCTIWLKMSKRNLYSWFSTVLGISKYMLQAENTLRNHTKCTFNTVLLLCLGFVVSRANISYSGQLFINFQVPKGWKMSENNQKIHLYSSKVEMSQFHRKNQTLF